ncbi:MAG: peptide deformylase [Bacteroidales bacterium]|nr:peptide deformylase [Bacteroidales bacterium]
MILPIVSYGQSVLRQKCEEIDQTYPDLNKLIEDMWETLYPADGSGLAASQVGHLIKLFIVDSKEVFDRMEAEERVEFFVGDKGIKETFINAKITKYSDDLWIEDEGCLSIPTLSEEVTRSWTIEIEYFNKDFQKQTKTYSGTTARIIQHEFDHTEGKLYIDYVNPLKRKLLNSKLIKISKGEIKAKYKMVYGKS